MDVEKAERERENKIRILTFHNNDIETVNPNSLFLVLFLLMTFVYRTRAGEAHKPVCVILFDYHQEYI